MNHINIYSHATGVSYLKTVYQMMNQSNPRFSQRSFANKIGLDQSSLLRYFSNQRFLSVEKAEHIASRLSMNEQDTHYFKLLTVFGDRGHSAVIEKIRSSFLFSNYAQSTRLEVREKVSGKEALLNLRYFLLLETTNLKHQEDQKRILETINFYLPTSETERENIFNDLIQRGFINKETRSKNKDVIELVFLEGDDVPRDKGLKFHSDALSTVATALNDYQESDMEIYSSILSIKKEGREQIHQALRHLQSLLVEFHTHKDADDIFLVSCSMLNLTNRFDKNSAAT